MGNLIFLDVNFDDKNLFLCELTKLYGVGSARAKNLCAISGLSLNNRIFHLNEYYLELISFLIKEYYGTDALLLRIQDNSRRIFLTFKSYKAVRFAAGLPIRGQKTHTNARTSKRLKTDFKQINQSE